MGLLKCRFSSSGHTDEIVFCIRFHRPLHECCINRVHDPTSKFLTRIQIRVTCFLQNLPNDGCRSSKICTKSGHAAINFHLFVAGLRRRIFDEYSFRIRLSPGLCQRLGRPDQKELVTSVWYNWLESNQLEFQAQTPWKLKLAWHNSITRKWLSNQCDQSFKFVSYCNQISVTSR